MSSVEEFFDIIFLGVFIILSPAFDSRFYPKPPSTLAKEAANAVHHFNSLLNIFSQRFIVLLDGDPVDSSYIVHRMLGEFAAAAVVFSKAIHDARDEEERVGITFFKFIRQVEGILDGSYPTVFPYYSRCFDRGHKHFVWTGPDIEILERTEALDSLISHITTGELLDLPSYKIYTPRQDTNPPPLVGKRHDRGDNLDIANEKSRKRRR
jgi:hypothetical protein